MEKGELTLEQIDFSLTFDRICHSGLSYEMCDVGVGGPVNNVKWRST